MRQSPTATVPLFAPLRHRSGGTLGYGERTVAHPAAVRRGAGRPRRHCRELRISPGMVEALYRHYESAHRQAGGRPTPTSARRMWERVLDAVRR